MSASALDIIRSKLNKERSVVKFHQSPSPAAPEPVSIRAPSFRYPHQQAPQQYQPQPPYYCPPYPLQYPQQSPGATLSFIATIKSFILFLALVAIFGVTYPILSASADLSATLSAIIRNPISTLTGAVLDSARAIPGAWCEYAGFGCASRAWARGRDTAIWEKQKQIQELGLMDISTGDDIYGCFKDLYMVRLQQYVASHMMALAGDLEKYSTYMEKDDRALSALIRELAVQRNEVVRSSNRAAQHGHSGIHSFVHHYHLARLLAGSSHDQSKLRSQLQHTFTAPKTLFQDAVGETQHTNRLLKGAEIQVEIISTSARRIHERVLRMLSKKSFVRRAVETLGMISKDGREDLVSVLGDIIEVIDKSRIVLSTTKISLEQCKCLLEQFGSEFSHLKVLISSDDPQQEIRLLEPIVRALVAMKEERATKRNVELSGPLSSMAIAQI